MRLRIFDAPTMQAALARMRETLGSDAVIVASQETADGVRLTAAVDGPRPAIDDLLRPRPDEGRSPKLRATLAQHGTPPELLLRLLAVRSADGDECDQLTAALRGELPFAQPLEHERAPVLLAGLAGAGKTTLAARLAARWLLAGHEVTVVAADRDRSGGVAQLAELLAPMSLAPVMIHDAGDLVRLLRSPGPGRRVVVDLPAIDPFRGEDLARLADLARIAGKPATVVMPAGLDAADSAEMAQNLVALGCRRMVVTRLDTARRLGGVLAAAGAGLAVADATASPLIAKGLLPLEPGGLARLLLAHADAAQPSPTQTSTATRKAEA